MSATGQPYSHAAWTAAIDAYDHPTRMKTSLHAAMDAAHDREALGLDASVHAASYRREVIEEVAAWLEGRDLDEEYATWMNTAAHDLREFGATETKP